MGLVAISTLTTNQINVNASDLNGLATPIQTEFNGNIENVNIKSSAAIAISKIALTGAILNTHVNASAAIAGSKISPDFGAQNIVTTGTLGAGTTSLGNTTVTGTFHATGALTLDAAYKGKIVSFNSSESSSLSATNATTNYIDSGLTAITFTPSNASNIIIISWGLAGYNSTNYGGLKSCVRIGSTNYVDNASGASNGNDNAVSDTYTTTGTIIKQLASASQVVKVYFMNGAVSGLTTSTAGAKRAWLHIVEVYNG